MDAVTQVPVPVNEPVHSYAPGSPERERYVFRPGLGPGGVRPPNDWQSVFGGPAWTRVPGGEWYLHPAVRFSPGDRGRAGGKAQSANRRQ